MSSTDTVNTDFAEYEDGVYGRCRGCGCWTRHASVTCPWIALCSTCGKAASGPDNLHRALASVLGAHHWRAFCDAWLAIGLAAAYVDELHCNLNPRMLGELVGRVVRRRR